MSKLIGREIRLKSRPDKFPTLDNFELVETEIPEPKEGEVLVKNLFMSVDPYMRGRMNASKNSYVRPFEIGVPLSGFAVGQVLTSNSNEFASGDYVITEYGWREYSISSSKKLRKLPTSTAPLSTFLGTLGMTGLTAYIGLQQFGEPKKGDTLFVSAASGAVGSIVCQIGKILGCRVVGSAGSDEKVTWLKEVALVDEAFNYNTVNDLQSTLNQYCSDGIDIYFDNVGGNHLMASFNLMNKFGRIVVCGQIAEYNEPVPSPLNVRLFIVKRLKMQGFLVFDHEDQHPQFLSEMAMWIKDGKIKWKETIVENIENAPEAFIGLFKGENIGKMIVKIAD